MIEKYIKELLEQEGRVAVPDLGTFFTKQQPASINTEDAIVLPPTEAIAFTESIIDLQKDDLRNLIFEKGEMFASQIEVEIENYVADVKTEISSMHTYTIEGLGDLKKGEEGIFFEPKSSFSVNSESFGLPKIEARPIEAVSEDGQQKEEVFENEVANEKPTNASIPWLFIAPLALLAIAVAYFFFNPAAYENIKLMFPQAKPDAEIAAPAANKDAENVATEEDKDSVVIQTKPIAETKEKPETKPTSTQPTVTSTQADIVTEKTNRYYLIAGSFKTAASAQKALTEAKEKGYSGAKIVKSDNRYRLSIGDYPTKSAATQAGVTASNKDYKGAWPFKF